MTKSLFSRLSRFAIVALAAAGLASCGVNTVPTKQEAAKAQWGQVQSAYQRRADLIPNLVESVKAAAGSENQILSNVINARARATSINVTTNDLSNPETFQKFQAAQNQLTQALGQLRTVVENYPTLQSQARFADLMTALEARKTASTSSATATTRRRRTITPRSAPSPRLWRRRSSTAQSRCQFHGPRGLRDSAVGELRHDRADARQWRPARARGERE